MKRKSIWKSFVLLIVLSGCESTIHVQEVPIAQRPDISTFSTYRWDRSSMVTHAPRERTSTEYNEVIVDAIERKMAELGFQKRVGDDADLIMDFRVTIADSVAQSAIEDTEVEYKSPYGLKWRFGKGEKTVQLEQAMPDAQLAYYQNGTLHVGAFDRTKKMVWHSMAHKIIDDSHSSAEHADVLKRTVDLIMRRFPASAVRSLD